MILFGSAKGGFAGQGALAVRAIAFATMSWTKTPAYAALEQFTRTNMLARRCLSGGKMRHVTRAAPAARSEADRLGTLIFYLLMILLTIKLMTDALIA